MTAATPIPAIWTTGSTEGNKTGTWRAALPRYIEAPAPCHVACPVNGDIAEWIGRARQGDMRGAWDILTRHNPFPAVIGRVCHHPCESACNRTGWDQPLAICLLERFIGDRALAEGWTFAPATVERDEQVAVVGGGPSGLSAAFHLRRLGYAVTLFEASPALGGLLRHGIPPYRLPRHIVDGEIARIIALGIEVRLEVALDARAMLSRLRAGYDAVYIAIGAGRPKRLPQLDYAKPWVIDGADYLVRSNAGEVPFAGVRIVVIGGGSAAMDVARSARRAGSHVTVVALETAARMPAQREEVVEALEEGIVIHYGAALMEAIETGDGSIALRCVAVRFEAGIGPGESTITPIAGSGFVLQADAVVTAIGQDPDLAPLAGVVDTDGPLVKVDPRQATAAAHVYAGGDVASMARYVSEAIGMGQRAALDIDRVLRTGRSLPADGVLSQPAQVVSEPIVQFAAINTFYHPKQARPLEQRLDPQHRLRADNEVQLPLDIEAALAEAARCFSCGACIQCDNCVHYCPDLAVMRVGGDDGRPDSYRVLTDYCKGCGMCVRECPTGSMTMQEEKR